MSQPNPERDERVRTPRELAKYITANWPGYANPVDALEALITERDRQVGAMLPEIVSETVLASVESRDHAFTDRCERKCVILSVEERDAICRGVRKVRQAQNLTYFADDARIYAGEELAFGSGATTMRERCVEKVREMGQQWYGEAKKRGAAFSDKGRLAETIATELQSLTLEQGEQEKSK